MTGIPVIRTAVREPRQRRSREAWARVLDAGVDILTTHGYDGFTIASVCEVSDVVPRFIYDRVDTKEDLFLAVYEHGVERLRLAETGLEQWAESPPEERVRGAVAAVARSFRVNTDFLRVIVVLSASHTEVAARGVAYRAAFEERFAELLAPLAPDIAHEDADAAVRHSFDVTFAAWVVRTGHGPGFAGVSLSDDEFDTRLQDQAVRYLLG